MQMGETKHCDTVGAMLKMLKNAGATVIGCTPILAHIQPGVRPREITQHRVMYNRKAKAEGRPLIKKWVAVDDRPLTRELGGEKVQRGDELLGGLQVRLARREQVRLPLADRDLRVQLPELVYEGAKSQNFPPAAGQKEQNYPKTLIINL